MVPVILINILSILQVLLCITENDTLKKYYKNAPKYFLYSALKSLFLIYEIPSLENPKAHSQYCLFDSGVFNALLGGKQTVFSQLSALEILIINEINAQYEYSGKLKPNLYYYRTRGGAKIDLVLKTKGHMIGIECTNSIDVTPYQQRGMKSFLKAYPQATGYFIAPIQEKYKLDKNLHVIPWTFIG